MESVGELPDHSNLLLREGGYPHLPTTPIKQEGEIKAKLVVNMMRYLDATKNQAKAIVDGVFDGEHTINKADLSPLTTIKQEPRLTDWISGNLKPVRYGVYQRKYDDGTEVEKVHFCKFENGLWFSWQKNIENANAEYVESVFQNFPWRGLSSNPNEVQS